jgi:hypothetical protein
MAKKKKLHGKVKGYTTLAVDTGKAEGPEKVLARFYLPLGEVGEKEYLSRHVESRLKTLEQRIAMKRLLRGLQQAGAKTKDGRPVQRPGEVVRWLLEQIT